MNLYVDFEVMLFNNLKLEEIWSAFGDNLNIFSLILNLIKYFTGNYVLKGNLRSLCFSTYFTNMYAEHLQGYDITILMHEKYKLYYDLLLRHTRNLSKIKQIKIFNDINSISITEFDDTFFSSFKQTIQFKSKYMIVENLLSYLYMIINTSVQHYRVSFFNGSFWILWSAFSYYLIIIFAWPVLFKTKNLLFDINKMFISMLIFMIQIACVRIMRTLQEVDYERFMLHTQNTQPLCGHEYILYGTSIFVSTIFYIFLVALVLYFMFKYTIVSCILLIPTMTYYVVMLSEIYIKIPFTFISIVLSQILIQYEWFVKLFLV